MGLAKIYDKISIAIFSPRTFVLVSHFRIFVLISVGGAAGGVKPVTPAASPASSLHVMLVVDMSGSMRQNDVVVRSR